MNIVEIKHVEDCFDGSFIKEILFDREITKEFILYLGNIGKLQYFPGFARPFFRIDAQGVALKGVENNNSMRVVLYDRSKLETLCQIIKEYINGGDYGSKVGFLL
jgi:hypothetical protein